MIYQRLDSVADITMGQAPDGESYNTEGEGIPLVAGAGDFGSQYPIVKKYTRAPGKICQAGDIILGIRATIGEKVLADRPYCLGRGVAGIRPKQGLYDRYLWHWFAFASPILISKAKGATFKQVTREDIGELCIILPSLSEQQRIANILDKADELRAKRSTALALLDTMSQSIFHDIFGDPITIFKKWHKAKLGDVLDFLTSGSRGWAKHYSNDGELFLRIQNVKQDRLLLDDIAFVNAPDTIEAKRTRVQPGDVLLSITADIGRTAVVPNDIGSAYINQHLAILRTNSFVPRFLSAYLVSPTGQGQILSKNRQGVKAGLNFDDIRSLVIPMPPRDLQLEFEKRVNEIDSLVISNQISLKSLNLLFLSLQHRTFRGEL